MMLTTNNFQFPGLGYLFSGWSGDLNSSENPLNLSIDSNLSLVANFLVEPEPFDFNASELTVYEDAGVGTEIGHVYRVSGDLNNTVEFSLELDGYESSFSVDNNGSKWLPQDWIMRAMPVYPLRY